MNTNNVSVSRERELLKRFIAHSDLNNGVFLLEEIRRFTAAFRDALAQPSEQPAKCVRCHDEPTFDMCPVCGKERKFPDEQPGDVVEPVGYITVHEGRVVSISRYSGKVPDGRHGFYVAALSPSVPAEAVADGPDVPDGHDWEGFPGGCKRFGHGAEDCPERKSAEAVAFGVWNDWSKCVAGGIVHKKREVAEKHAKALLPVGAHSVVSLYLAPPANDEAVRLLRDVWECPAEYGLCVGELLGGRPENDELCAEVEDLLEPPQGGSSDGN